MSTLLIRLAANVVSPIGITFGVYLLVRGHHSPGGGFVAALVLGLVVVLRQWAFGPEAIRGLLRLGVGSLIGWGLVLMLGTGAAGWWWGDHFLATHTWHPRVPVVGEVVVSSSLLFETGVAMTVVAVVVAVIAELREGQE